MTTLTLAPQQIFTNQYLTATIVEADAERVVVDWYIHSDGDEQQSAYLPGVVEAYLLTNDFQQYHPDRDELTPLV